MGTVRYTGWRGRRQGRDEQIGEEKSRYALLECFSRSLSGSQGTPGHREGVDPPFSVKWFEAIHSSASTSP